MKAFISHAEHERWIEESPARGLAPPKCDSPPTIPVDVNEMVALLEASADKPKERALLLLMRYSGVAIGDAVMLRSSAIQPDGHVILRRAKTGTLVTVPLPSYVLDALEVIAEPGCRHYF